MKNSDEIKVVVVNPPTEEEAKKKTKELCEFLSSTWHLKIKTQ